MILRGDNLLGAGRRDHQKSSAALASPKRNDSGWSLRMRKPVTGPAWPSAGVILPSIEKSSTVRKLSEQDRRRWQPQADVRDHPPAKPAGAIARSWSLEIGVRLREAAARIARSAGTRWAAGEDPFSSALTTLTQGLNVSSREHRCVEGGDPFKSPVGGGAFGAEDLKIGQLRIVCQGLRSRTVLLQTRRRIRSVAWDSREVRSVKIFKARQRLRWSSIGRNAKV